MDKVCPVITLDNGIRIANWSSPHEFKFTTGEILRLVILKELKQ